MSNTIRSSRESNPSRRIYNLRVVPVGHVNDKMESSGISNFFWCEVGKFLAGSTEEQSGQSSGSTSLSEVNF